MNYVFLTTPTSATASIWRVLSRVVKDSIVTPNRYTDSFYHDGCLEKLQDEKLPEDGDLLLLHNVPQLFNLDQVFENTKFIVNVRDPRDLLCNMYHWRMVHDEPNLSKEELELRKKELEERGIDQFVLDQDIRPFFSKILEIVSSEKIDYEPLTYSLLCQDFDLFLLKAAGFFDIELTQEMIDDLEIERTENLESNGQWIGNQWQGSDVLPGRYKRELQADTIAKLEEIYAQEIDFVEKMDTIAHSKLEK